MAFQGDGHHRPHHCVQHHHPHTSFILPPLCSVAIRLLSPSDSLPPTPLASLQLCFYFFSKKVYQSSGGEMVAHTNFRMGLVIGLILYPFNDFQGISGSELQQLSCLLLKSLGNNLCPSRRRSCLCCTDSTGDFPRQGTCWARAEHAKPRDGPRGQGSLREHEVSWKGGWGAQRKEVLAAAHPPSPLHPMTRQTSARELTGLLQDSVPIPRHFGWNWSFPSPFITLSSKEHPTCDIRNYSVQEVPVAFTILLTNCLHTAAVTVLLAVSLPLPAHQRDGCVNLISTKPSSCKHYVIWM